MERLQSFEQLQRLRQKVAEPALSERPCIAVCSGMGCEEAASADVAEALRRQWKEQGLEGKVDFKVTGCHGFCSQG
ncbi:MAG: (2Fe-2S) ferredoxin domain-containing protein, partial [Deltaproteobacteria bacterium]